MMRRQRGSRVTERGRRNAEAKRAGADALRRLAEGRREQAELGRAKAEGARDETERLRVAQESLRQGLAGSLRAQDALRVTAEAAREATELLRRGAEAARRVAGTSRPAGQAPASDRASLTRAFQRRETSRARVTRTSRRVGESQTRIGRRAETDGQAPPPPSLGARAADGPRRQVPRRLAPASVTGGSLPRVLLVEDNAAVRDVVRESLEGAGFEVDAATTATEGTERLAQRRYAAILSDCVLPDLPPLEWLAVARAAAPATPLVVYSGAVHLDELQELAREWRVAAVLAKPFSQAQLVEAVRHAIGAGAGGGR